MLDMIIVGAGPAGITAAVYAARKRLDFIVISKDIGGQTAWSGEIENYTGYQFISGPDLVKKFEEHMKAYNVAMKEGDEVLEITRTGDRISVKTKKAVYESRTVIIASGKRVRELGAAGENEFKNRGLTYCATCDAPLFSGKDVAVIGGGNSALDAVLQLMKIAKSIYLINILGRLTGDPIMQEKVLASGMVKVLNSAEVVEILGDKFVTGIRVKKGDGIEKLDVQGVFVEIGLVPNSQMAIGVDKTASGEIKVNNDNATNVPGIFAAGDVTNVPEKQIIIAAGEGSKAVLSAFRYISQMR
ncbi:MAG: FAD-dependent oxidoreductase [Candidatus Omnitrophota bacterium]|jgi:alkyl hydroperoxide reductase subunit F